MTGVTRDGVMRAAVFLSGSGRTLANLIDHRDHHSLPIDIPLVIGSRERLGGLEIASRHGIETRVVPRPAGIDEAVYQGHMFDPVRDAGCDFVIMAGFLKHVLIPDDFNGRVINIHPSLLPAFGGPGMYGGRVHAAAIQRGVQVSGCTVHYVDNLYDNGPIILQRWCQVEPQDTPEQLAAKVFELEKEALPSAIQKICSPKKSAAGR